MYTYFCGNDNFHCALGAHDPEVYQTCVPVQIDDIFGAILRWDLMLYRKSANDLTWYLSGLGVATSTIIFTSKLRISEVSLTSETAVGLSEVENSLYIVSFSYDDAKKLTWNIQAVIKPSSIEIRQLVSNDKAIFGIDRNSGIYEINSELHLKWRVEGVNLTKLYCGFDHFVAQSDTGALYVWGSGSRGQLGLRESTLKCENPTRIEFFDDLPSIVTKVSCGGWHTLALTSDGDVYSWGWNESLQLGHSFDKIANFSSDPYPIDLGSAIDPIVSISAGARHSVCLLKSGKVYTFGLNTQGQLGVGDTENRKEPSEIIFNFKNKPIDISCGRYSTFIYT